MTMSKQATDLRRSAETVLTTKRRQAGTSLVEILVVIVIFLIGILAVVQVFPRGFRILLTSRNNSVATAIGRNEIERIKDRPDLLPDEVLAVRYVNGNPEVDPTLNPLALGPLGDAIAQDGTLSTGGVGTRNWMLASGPNVARRIIGEGQRVPAPRQVGSNFGGLMVLDHGPIDSTYLPVAYGNELSRTIGAPRESNDRGSYAVAGVAPNGTVTAFNARLIYTPVSTAPYEFFVVDPANPDASILLPVTLRDRTYRVRVSGLVGSGAGYRRVDFVSLGIRVPGITSNPDGITLLQVSLNDLLHASGAMDNALTLGSTEVDTIRVAPQYVPLALAASWTDPFQMKIIDANVGAILFSPLAREGVVSRPGGVSEPLIAKVDYDVYDWRILHEEFRYVGNNATFPLALQSLKVGTQNGPDGRQNGWIAPLEGGVGAADNLVVVDLTTGFQLDESNSAVTVDKSRGLVTLNDVDPSTAGLDVRLVPPVGSPFTAPAFNRTFRVLYRARNEWAVQLLKGNSQYSVLRDATPVQGQVLVGGGAGGGLKTRLYFAGSEAGRKVTVDRIFYRRTDGTIHTLEGQDFLIRTTADASISLPHADLLDIDPNADGFELSGVYGEPVSGVKGASVSVRVLWNPDAFSLASDGAVNMSRVDIWGRGWRKSMTETYLRSEETR